MKKILPWAIPIILIIFILIFYYLDFSFTDKRILYQFESIDQEGKITYSKVDEVRLKGDKGSPIYLPNDFYLPRERFMSTWVATVDSLHFPLKNIDEEGNISLRNSEDELKKDWLEILDNHELFNLNTVIFQVSPTLDALYSSSHRPWSASLTGLQGTPPEWSESFDFISWAIEETHKRGMEFHAWFNPYRVTHKYESNAIKEEELAKLSEGNFARSNPNMVYIFDNRLYLDAGYPEVREHVVNVVKEFMNKYDTDSIHFDDYFYPYKAVRGDDTFYFGDKLEDQETFYLHSRSFSPPKDLSDTKNLEKYQKQVKEWRRENNNLMIESVAQAIKSHNEKNKSSIQFGISPFGIWNHKKENKLGSHTPKSSTASDRDMFADTLKWVREETIDYIIPQIYWEFSQPTAPFGEITDWWSRSKGKSRTNLYVGHADYKHMNAGWSLPWQNPEEIPNQILFTLNYPNITGNLFYGYISLLPQENPEDQIGILSQNRHIDILKNTYLTKRTLVPNKPWLANADIIELENINYSYNEEGNLVISFNDSLKNPSRFYIISTENEEKEVLKVVGRNQRDISQNILLPKEVIEGKNSLLLSTQYKWGEESKPFVLILEK